MGYKEAHGPSAIDLSMDRQQGNRDSRHRAKKPAVVPEEQADSAIKSSDDSDCWIVGVSVYGRQSGEKSAAPKKRKRPQPESEDESDFEPSAHESDTSDSHTSKHKPFSSPRTYPLTRSVLPAVVNEQTSLIKSTGSHLKTAWGEPLRDFTVGNTSY